MRNWSSTSKIFLYQIKYLRQVEEDLDGEGDDVHAGDAPVAAADKCEDDVGGAALHQALAALWGQSGGGVCRHTNTIILVIIFSALTLALNYTFGDTD